jgi:hypothetical protein
MDKHEFTKGVWKINDKHTKTAIASRHKHIAMVNYFDRGVNDPRTITGLEHIANARLIASAPELLCILEEITSAFSNKTCDTEAIELLNRATKIIARARTIKEQKE